MTIHQLTDTVLGRGLSAAAPLALVPSGLARLHEAHPDRGREPRVAPLEDGVASTDLTHFSRVERIAHDRAMEQLLRRSGPPSSQARPSPADDPNARVRAGDPRAHHQLDRSADGTPWAFGGNYEDRIGVDGAADVPFLGSSRGARRIFTRYQIWMAMLLVVVGRLHAQGVEGLGGALEAPNRPPMPSPAELHEIPRIHYDEPGDGNLWVRGADYKASFGPDGASFIPCLGSRAPRNFPLSLSPSLVTLAGEPLEFTRSARAERNEDRVELDRGSFVEAYDISLRSIEQTFEFPVLARRGEIDVVIPVEGEFEVVPTADGVEFRTEWGHIHYSSAIAIDARGRRSFAATEFVDGAIRIHVPTSFVAIAVLPLVIDPVISTFLVDDPNLTAHSVDVCWEPSFDCWLVAYNELYSAADNDVRVRIMNHDGTIRHSSYVDYTSANWSVPRCAGLAAWGQCLVVATKLAAQPSVVGRAVWTLNLAMYPQITISRTQDGPAQNPDVGGSPLADGTANYVVVYERVYAPGDRDIFMRRVRADNTLVGSAPFNVGWTTTVDQFRPQIARSTRTGHLAYIWERGTFNTGYSLCMGVAPPTGTYWAPENVVSFPQPTQFNASISSQVGPDPDVFAVVYERLSGSGGVDVQLALARGNGGGNSGYINLSRAEGWAATDSLVQPTVEVVGDRVVVTYARKLSASNSDLYCSEVFVYPHQPFQILQSRVPLALSVLDERRPQITGMWIEGDSNPAVFRDCVIAWDDNFNGGRIQAAMFRGN